MAPERQQPKERQQPNIASYVTVRDAIDLLGITERTVRRWIKQDRLHAIQDASGYIRIDLADIDQIRAMKPTTVPSLQKQVASLLERVEDLENHRQEQTQLIASLHQQVQGWQLLITHIEHQEEKEGNTTGVQLQSALADMLMKRPLHIRPSERSLVEKRGLPLETEHLVDFVKVHHPQKPMTIYGIKQLFAAGDIDLTVYHRTGHAQRNKQEWWITQEQHLQLVSYFQQHAISYVSCAQCQHLTAQKIMETEA